MVDLQKPVILLRLTNCLTICLPMPWRRRRTHCSSRKKRRGRRTSYCLTRPNTLLTGPRRQMTPGPSSAKVLVSLVSFSLVQSLVSLVSLRRPMTPGPLEREGVLVFFFRLFFSRFLTGPWGASPNDPGSGKLFSNSVCLSVSVCVCVCVCVCV